MPPRPAAAPDQGGAGEQPWRLNLGPEPDAGPRRVLPDWEDRTQWPIDDASNAVPAPLEGESTNPTNTAAADSPPELYSDAGVELPPSLDPEATAINLAAVSPATAYPSQWGEGAPSGAEDPEATTFKVGSGQGGESVNFVDDPDATAIRLAIGAQTNLNNAGEPAQIVYAELEPLEIDPVHLSIDPATTQLNIAGDDDAMDGYVFQARPLPQPSGTWDPLAVPELTSDAATWDPSPVQELYEAPPPPPPPPRRLTRRRVITVALVIVLLAVAAGAGWSAYRQRVVNDPNTKVPVATGAPSSATGTTGAEVVSNYLGALARGDIVTALSLGPTGDGSKALISADAYPSVWRSGKITDITVSRTDPSATDIPVTYSLNGQQVSTVMRVERHQDGSFTLARSTVTVQISGNGDGVLQVPLLVDTRPIGWNRSYELVPGVYNASTGLPFLAFTSNASLVVKDLAEVDTWTLAPQVTDKGQEAFFAAATETLNTCFQRKELSPPDCPFAETAKEPVKPESITRVPKGEPLADKKITLLANDLRQGQVQVVVSYTLSLTYASGATSGEDNLTRAAVLTMNLAVANADLLKPEWKAA